MEINVEIDLKIEGTVKVKNVEIEWTDTIALYNWSFSRKLPDTPNSNRIRNDRLAPKTKNMIEIADAITMVFFKSKIA